MAFIAKAVVDALRRHPIVNASLDGDNVVYKKDINLGIAVALESGLIVPVIKNADEKNLLGLSRAIADVAERARAKQLKPEEVHGGTFTITNPGQFGAQFGMPIINQPQVAILGVGTIEKRPVVVDDAIAIRTMAYLTLGYDHRLIDGAVADQFMADVKQQLETSTRPGLGADAVPLEPSGGSKSAGSASFRTPRRSRCSARSSRSGAPIAFPTSCSSCSIHPSSRSASRATAAARTSSPRAERLARARHRGLTRPAAAATSPITVRPDRRLSDPRSEARSLRRAPLRARPRGGDDPRLRRLRRDRRPHQRADRHLGRRARRSAPSASASHAGSPATASRST